MEKSADKMRVMAVITLVVGSPLALYYVSHLLLPLFGTTVVTVNLGDSYLVASELVVLGLAIVWLLVGAMDLLFAGRVKRKIRAAREKEREIEARICS